MSDESDKRVKMIIWMENWTKCALHICTHRGENAHWVYVLMCQLSSFFASQLKQQSIVGGQQWEVNEQDIIWRQYSNTDTEGQGD